MQANNYVRCERCGKESCNGCEGQRFEFRLLLCRVVLGNAQVMVDKDRTIQAPRAGHHSVVAYGKEARSDSTFAFSEFVVYDNDQVFPEYIIHYHRARPPGPRALDPPALPPFPGTPAAQQRSATPRTGSGGEAKGGVGAATATAAAVGMSAQAVEPHFMQTMTTGVGTLLWMPPELLGTRSSQARYGLKVDCFAFGVILWECLTQQPPWKDPSQRCFLVYTVQQGHRLQYTPEQRDAAPRGLVELMEACWHQAPGERPTFEEIARRLAHIARRGGFDRSSPAASLSLAAERGGEAPRTAPAVRSQSQPRSRARSMVAVAPAARRSSSNARSGSGLRTPLLADGVA